MNLGGDIGQIYFLLFQQLKNVLVRPIYGLLKIAILALSRFTPRKWSILEFAQKSSLLGLGFICVLKSISGAIFGLEKCFWVIFGKIIFWVLVSHGV